ncbi:MAG: hypothetical protein QOD51_1720 [Candidatus Eremiobacteraeota bacterium]|nr:hypothetical protein [Candidatus Eremiobacteraeota bacterium]
MPDVRALAASYGVRVELADLGDWGSARLVAEYDPDGPVIRINENALPHGSSCNVRDAIDRAIAHELYHHREAIGEIARIGNRASREAAADAFADTLTATGSEPADRASQPGSLSN